MEYEPNPKHRDPWQRGRRGSICPKGLDPAALLQGSVEDPSNPGKRYATDGCRPYCAQQHAPGRWHGYPEDWKAVPEKLWRNWVKEGILNKKHLKEYW